MTISDAADFNPGQSDPDESSTNTLDPLVPRAIDLPTVLPAGGLIDPAIGDIAKVFAAPTDPADWPAWRDNLNTWREQAQSRLGYNGAAYEIEASRWTSSCYSVALVWLWDERLFDHTQQRFTVDAFLTATGDHGGFDAVVLWHAYPIIGIDDRNQFDYYRDVPGLTGLIDQLHEHGLKVFIDYNPWDTGTRRAEHDDAEELALIAAELGCDGVFLDTMKEGDSRLITALQQANPRQVLEGESRVPNQRIEDHQLSWAQWFADSDAPGVIRAHWYERRHMMHSTRRWNRDHSDELQAAWMNGTGMLVWDTVFGVWVGWNERDKSTLRRVLRVQRALTDLLVHGQWAPLTDATEPAIAAGVYASRFELNELTLWTLVNRSTTDYTGRPLAGLDVANSAELFDLIAGRETDGIVSVPARSVAAVLRVTGERPAWLAGLLAEAPAGSFDADATFPQRQAERRVAGRASSRPLAAALTVTAGRRTLTISYRRRETGLYDRAPYVEEWKPLPPRLHGLRETSIDVDLAAVAVATHEVTNVQYQQFLDATGYRPRDGHRFLANWANNKHGAHNKPAPGTEHQAVTMLSLDDARAYAAWAGTRLPTEFEWQVAASEAAFDRSRPAVWNWTESEHSDGITRFVILKGGSAHESRGSDWYVDGGVRDPSFSLKYLLAGLGVERSTSIGFRVAWDLER